MLLEMAFYAVVLTGANVTNSAQTTQSRPFLNYCYYHDCPGRWHDMHWREHRRERDRWRRDHPDRSTHHGP